MSWPGLPKGINCLRCVSCALAACALSSCGGGGAERVVAAGGSSPGSGATLGAGGLGDERSGGSGGLGDEPSGGSGGGTPAVSHCDGSSLLLCDGFESGTIDSGLWSIETARSDDVVEVSTQQAARGAHSVHISTQNGYGYLRNDTVFPVIKNDYFGRMFLRVAQFSTLDWAHWTIAEATGNGDGSLVRVGGQYAANLLANRWGVGSDGGPTGDWTRHDGDPPGAVQEPPENRWVCVEWEHKGSTNETRFFLDGEEHPSLATTAQEHGGNSSAQYLLPEITSLWFGWWQYQQDSLRFEVWIDELAINGQRIGCD